jgi:hypothetical protein
LVEKGYYGLLNEKEKNIKTLVSPR